MGNGWRVPFRGSVDNNVKVVPSDGKPDPHLEAHLRQERMMKQQEQQQRQPPPQQQQQQQQQQQGGYNQGSRWGDRGDDRDRYGGQKRGWEGEDEQMRKRQQMEDQRREEERRREEDRRRQENDQRQLQAESP